MSFGWIKSSPFCCLVCHVYHTNPTFAVNSTKRPSPFVNKTYTDTLINSKVYLNSLFRFQRQHANSSSCFTTCQMNIFRVLWRRVSSFFTNHIGVVLNVRLGVVLRAFDGGKCRVRRCISPNKALPSTAIAVVWIAVCWSVKEKKTDKHAFNGKKRTFVLVHTCMMLQSIRIQLNKTPEEASRTKWFALLWHRPQTMTAIFNHLIKIFCSSFGEIISHTIFTQ